MSAASIARPHRPFLAAFAGEEVSRTPPIWLMRQAGRYLPEYRAVRAKAGSFLDLCYKPALAAEVTLQPIRRFGLDAAILFSDILVVPHALGQPVEFVEGEGPRLDPLRSVDALARLDPGRTGARFASVFETVARLRGDLPRETALIGFCGAPWTVATYMVEGGGSKDQEAARLWAYRDREGFSRLIELLVATSIEYLSGQVEAGADALQIFDTWAGVLPQREFEDWVISPTFDIVAGVKSRHPDVPIIGFPRGAGAKLQDYCKQIGALDGIGCDTSVPIRQMRALAKARDGEGQVVQGNLDPLSLLAGGELMECMVRDIMAGMADCRHIFNLGHGIVPQTPPEHVASLVELVRGKASA